MKTHHYCILLILTFFVSCTSKDENVIVPFELQPDGLKKKIEVELIAKSKEEIKKSILTNHIYFANYPPPIYCGSHLQLTIKRNNAEQVMVRNEIIDSIEEIQSGVFLYYTANASLNEAQTEKNIQDPNYKFLDYPFYSRMKLGGIEKRVEEHSEYLASAKEEQDENLIEFYQGALNEWKNKQRTIHILEVDELIEIQNQAFIQIEDAANKKGLSPMTEEAIRGILNVRNYASQKYFGVSYYSLYFDATRKNDAKAQDKMNAIDYLYQMKIVDESYARLEGLRTKYYQEPSIEIMEEDIEAPSQVEATPPPTESIIQE